MAFLTSESSTVPTEGGVLREGAARDDSPAPRAFRPSIAVSILLVVTTIAVAAGLLLRLAILESGSLWLDELWTLDAASRSLKEMVGARLVSDQSPPLWTTLTWFWLQVAGTYDAGTMRLLALGSGLVGVVAALIGAYRMHALRPALLVLAALLSLSTFPLQFSVEMRAYALMIGLGTVATVIWAGLLTNELPRSGRWIFLFAVSGSLAGFGHYYGNLLYIPEAVLLLAVFAQARSRKPLVLLGLWSTASVVPVITWYFLTSRWFPGQAVAGPPSFSTIRTWAEYAYAPVTTVTGGQVPGYATEGAGVGVLVIAATICALVVVALLTALRVEMRANTKVIGVGLGALIVVAAGLGLAWIASILRPPSMNVRNLAALLPVVFLALGCSITWFRSERTRSLLAGLAIATLLVANIVVVGGYGATSLTPPWQEQAGYRATVRALLAAENGSPAPQLIGLLTTWAWHGQWDAAVRSELRAGPAVSSDAPPIVVTWVNGPEELVGTALADGPVIVFSDSFDSRASAVFDWVRANRTSCREETVGGPAFGAIQMLRCL